MNEIDKQIERLIDQQSSDGESTNRIEFSDQQQLDFELQLQKKIDASLRRNFPVEPIKESLHREKMDALVASSRLPERRRMAVRVMVLAASVLLLASLVFLPNKRSNSPDIVFNRQPLAKLYQSSLDRGFKPYYVCDDPIRFAAQFKKQQGVPLRLAEMPEHKKMVGISFPGGISRTTTAMLGRVSGEPVLVFVDKLSEDDEEMRSQVGKSGQYHISRSTKEGLVFYEVSGFEDAQLIEYFERDAPQ